MTATIKIFEMNDCDWMAAENLESAIEEYKKNYGGDDNPEMTEGAREVTEQQMDSLKFDMRTNDAFKEGDPEHVSFREALAKMIADGATAPFFFASTEF